MLPTSSLLPASSKELIAASITRTRVDTRGLLFRLTLRTALALTLLVLVVLLTSVAVDSSDHILHRFNSFLNGTLRSTSTDEKLGVHQGLYGSLWIALIVAVSAFPLGICAAIHLEEYARENKLTAFVKINVQNLAGVPSVVYGLLGLTLLVQGDLFGLDKFTGGKSTLSAGIILSILVLPIVIITTSESLKAVPDSLKEGAYGLGATKWEMIRTQVLPYAAPGILTGTLLSISRAVGETAPLILVGAISGRLGHNPELLDVDALTDSFTALPVIITTWTQQSGRDSGFTAAAAGAIVVLLVMILIVNSTAIGLRNRFERKRT